MMAAVRGKGNKTTERRLRAALVRGRVSGWTLRPNDTPGRPDFFFEHERVAVFVDGCFWHGCPTCGHTPKTNTAFWAAKIARNRERDGDTTLKLHSCGIHVLRFWEHELSGSLSGCLGVIQNALLSRSVSTSSIPASVSS
jgi:DNA mismatch endonuclease (patch repair protein)